MSARATRPPSYLARLLAELDEIHAGYAEVISASAIRNIDPGPGFVGFHKWGWAESSADLEASRMALLRLVRGWEPRFRLLFPHTTPTVSKRLDEHLGRGLALVDVGERPVTAVPRSHSRVSLTGSDGSRQRAAASRAGGERHRCRSRPNMPLGRERDVSSRSRSLWWSPIS
jgi:hypothetical protein